MTGNVLVTHIDEASVEQLQRHAEALGISPGEYVTRLITLHAWAEDLTAAERPPDLRAAALDGLRGAGLPWQRPGA